MQHMMLQNSKFKIQHPSGNSPILGISMILIISMTWLIRKIQSDYTPQSILYLGGAQILIYTIFLVIFIYRKSMKPTVLLISQDTLFINDRIVEANEIKMLLVTGYFRPILGIKPNDKKYVPTDLCFRFLEEEDKGMKELKNWAEQNQIPFRQKGFTRWI
ncbi:hypothetical protein PBAT_21310 [Paenibacillus antarcticus]|uniref:Uncharacterized protein n=2 Tax=Paenibacillus antarcticus TaxID=253703 RepID=A0A162MAH1_9BACL|nr:hypothetical protein [Paenibacillus antarcticus]OAB41103.1 hypothetical protein PBAT_21310 [Paenibacillus antarcticus]